MPKPKKTMASGSGKRRTRCANIFRENGTAPIASEGLTQPFVDPLPQALVLTAIVIGLGTTALLVSFAVRIYEKYDTFDIRKIRKLRG